MSISQQARDVITRKLPPEKIKQRPGGGGMTFDYVTPATVIDILNEAFDYQWDMRVFDSRREDSTVIVGIELKVQGEDGALVVKQQFGCCEITRGLGVGEAFKGAASDALKKTATLFGVALELYQDSDVTIPSVPRKPASSSEPGSSPAPPASAKPTTREPSRATPPRPPAPLAPKAPAAPAAPVAPPAPPKQSDNPFEDDAPTTTANVPVPRPAAALPQNPRPAPAPPVAKKVDPFGGGAVGGLSPTQLNALTNIASRKELSQLELIALASVLDAEGNAKTAFDELENAEAIQVIRAAQQ